MEIGDWYREKVFNSQNGKDEWKYYFIKELVPENKDVEMGAYRIYYDGKVSAPHKVTSLIELMEKLTKVSAEHACSVLKILAPDTDSIKDLLKDLN